MTTMISTGPRPDMRQQGGGAAGVVLGGSRRNPPAVLPRDHHCRHLPLRDPLPYTFSFGYIHKITSTSLRLIKLYIPM
ncbi:hypothetical protein E2C01_000224 [Portunus trituberculatus]|uniref:Uncharacterized protein n=1 Tax=Portunus trituberculatus TaxID=210409 RepID=A0A5B7CEM9_PORTR|nr:hypothetical protein [Portunus trituberculatus]